MASVTRPAGVSSAESGPARAQVLALTAVVVAAMLLTLVTLVNAAAYTVVETTDEPTPGDDAVRHRAMAVDGTERILDTVNRASHETTRSARVAAVNGIETLDDDLSGSAADRGAVAYLGSNVARTTPGWIVSAGSPDGSLVNASGASAYTLAADVDRSRRVVLVVDPTQLERATRHDAHERAFRVVFETRTTTTAVYVYRTAGDVVVAAGTDTETPREVCAVSAVNEHNRLRLALSGEQLGTVRCPDLWPASSLASARTYRIGVENADAAEGTLMAIVRTATTPDSPPIADHDGISPGVYDATVAFGYASETHRFETTVRVAPGEPHA